MQRTLWILALCVLVLSVLAEAQVPQKISYQGLLKTSLGTPVPDGNYNIQFDIYNLPSGGTLRYTQTSSTVSVQKGTFNVLLGPMSNIFSESLYVQVTLLSGPGAPVTFSPRSELASAPYSMQSLSLLGPGSIATGTNAIAGGTNNRARGNYSVVSGGGGANVADSSSANGLYSTVSGGLRNTASGSYAVIGGGDRNAASGGNGTTIGGGQENNGSGTRGTISGGLRNYIDASSYASTIGGGQYNAIGPWSSVTIAGGEFNVANGDDSFIGGGGGPGSSFRNETSGRASVICGGFSNYASGNFSFIGGGSYNKARGLLSVVSGGGGEWPGTDSNSAVGNYAMIPGGRGNKAAGDYSFAAGRRAKANNHGAFVWADSADADFASTANNQFLIRASGGVGIGKNNPSCALDVNGDIKLTGNVTYSTPRIGYLSGMSATSGRALSPWDSVSWNYGLYNYGYVLSNYEIPLMLPDGVSLTSVDVTGIDTDPAAELSYAVFSTAIFGGIQGDSTFGMASSGVAFAGGYFVATTTFPPQVVDNSTHSYNMEFYLPPTYNVRFCNYRATFTYNTPGAVSTPVVQSISKVIALPPNAVGMPLPSHGRSRPSLLGWR